LGYKKGYFTKRNDHYCNKEEIMNTDQVITLMNKAIEVEYQAFIQYFYQSLLLKGFNTLALSQFLAAEADVELGHAKLLAEMVVNLGGHPSDRIEPVQIGNTPREMIQNNINREEQAIEVYRKLLPLVEENEYMSDTIYNILLSEVKDIDEFRVLLPAE
jgi:bacterioferritin